MANTVGTFEPIAIVGIGCRFPGDIHSPGSFWEALEKGHDGVSEIPVERFDVDAFYDGTRSRKGTIYTRRAGCVGDLTRFDASFFGFSPREAAHVDPQQRLLLEVTWEAFEDAGIPVSTLAGQQVGVFVGLFMHDFENMHNRPSELELFSPYSATGMSTSIAANRLSYVFDFRGPSLVVDTACSSSLVATHMACRSLQSGESTIAVAGGVNVLLGPEMFVALCEANMLGPSGLCRSFDHRADGYVRAEGAGVVVLKTLAAAERDGDSIYAVIAGTATNQDGRTDSLSQPSETAQMTVARAALHAAGLDGTDVGFVEAHGTGTPVGDPIEARSLGVVFGAGRPVDEPCVIGSVKSNFGHTESAAGIAGLIKATLMVDRGCFVPNLHFERPNPAIPLDELKLRVATRYEPWRPLGAQRIASVNSFGFGGSNANVIVRQYERPAAHRGNEGRPSVEPAVVVLSARSPEALAATARAWADAVGADDSVADVAWTAARHRVVHGIRGAVVAAGIERLRAGLEALAAAEPTDDVVVGDGPVGDGRPVFVLSGMGQQWPAMGRDLYDGETVFRNVVDRCCAGFARLTTEWNLVDELRAAAEESRIERTDVTQPCIFALQLGLMELLQQYGLEPAALVGHSVGEMAALHMAGCYGFDDAVRLAFHRGRLQQRTAGQGRMLAVGCDVEAVRDVLAELGPGVSVAAVNGPASLTLSGDGDQLERIERRVSADGTFARFVRVDVPFHSSAMDCILDELEHELRSMKISQPSVPLVSTVTGDWVTTPVGGGDYWRRNVREPVQFSRAMDRLFERGYGCFVEVSAHPVLGPSLRECAGTRPVHVVPTLRRGKPGRHAVVRALGASFCAGCTVDAVGTSAAGRFLRLPTYPWQRERYWSESEASRAWRANGIIATGSVGPVVHPLLGARVEVALPTWQCSIDVGRSAYLRDHVVDAAIVHPAAAFIETALAAAREKLGSSPCRLRGFKILAPLVHDLARQTVVQSTFESGAELVIQSRMDLPELPWRLNATCSVEAVRVPEAVPSDDVEGACSGGVADDWYARLAERGLRYGPAFRVIERFAVRDGRGYGRLRLQHGLSTKGHLVHPTLIDGALQCMALLAGEGTYLPVGVESASLYRALDDMASVEVVMGRSDATMLQADIVLRDGR